jgi:hypothetical protein
MNFRFSIASYWFEVYILESLMLGTKLIFQVSYGHNSQDDLIVVKYYPEHPYRRGWYLNWRGKTVINKLRVRL